VLENLKGILEAAGSNLHHVVKDDGFSEGHQRFFGHERSVRQVFHVGPARTIDGAGWARLPKDALVEIEAIAGL